MAHDREFVRIVEEQGRRPVGIPVLLFTDETLAATDESPAADGGRRTQLVRDAAEAIGVDLAEVALFSTDAYLIQSVAGHLAVENES